jgi:hypothetical protein
MSRLAANVSYMFGQVCEEFDCVDCVVVDELVVPVDVEPPVAAFAIAAPPPARAAVAVSAIRPRRTCLDMGFLLPERFDPFSQEAWPMKSLKAAEEIPKSGA